MADKRLYFRHQIKLLYTLSIWIRTYVAHYKRKVRSKHIYHMWKMAQIGNNICAFHLQVWSSADSPYLFKVRHSSYKYWDELNSIHFFHWLKCNFLSGSILKILYVWHEMYIIHYWQIQVYISAFAIEWKWTVTAGVPPFTYLSQWIYSCY